MIEGTATTSVLLYLHVAQGCSQSPIPSHVTSLYVTIMAQDRTSRIFFGVPSLVILDTGPQIRSECELQFRLFHNRIDRSCAKMTMAVK